MKIIIDYTSSTNWCLNGDRNGALLILEIQKTINNKNRRRKKEKEQQEEQEEQEQEVLACTDSRSISSFFYTSTANISVLYCNKYK